MAAAWLLQAKDETLLRLVTAEMLRDDGFEVVEVRHSDEARALLDDPDDFPNAFEAGASKSATAQAQVNAFTGRAMALAGIISRLGKPGRFACRSVTRRHIRSTHWLDAAGRADHKPALRGGLIVLALGFVAAFVPAVCLAKMAPDAQVDPAMHAWFEAQHSIAGAWCCDISDGYMLPDSEWHVTGDKYEVRINGKWIEILPGQLRDPSGGFNPTGHAVVWYASGEWGVRIYCFAPGQFY